jgi:hypothetical protein
VAGGVRELASGVDALYLSGWAPIPQDVREKLLRGRERAEAAGEPVPFRFGGHDFAIKPHGLRKYPFCLQHERGLILLNPSSGALPPVAVQPRAALLHGEGPLKAAEWFEETLAYHLGVVDLKVSRVDLHVDVQGWKIDANERDRFVCRPKARTTYEDDGRWTGFILGHRRSGTVECRIYDKTEQLKGIFGIWEDIWGGSFDRSEPVIRVEFEVMRNCLREFGLSTPPDVVNAAGGMWLYLTTQWLTYRVRTADETRSRWPLSPEWLVIQRASLASGAHGIDRMRSLQRRATLQGLAPSLNGYLASFAACVGTTDIEDTCAALPLLLRQYGSQSGTSFEERVLKKASGT